MEAMTDPNLAQQLLRAGPKNIEMRKRTSRTAAFQTIGPRAMMAMRVMAPIGGSPVRWKLLTKA